MPELLSNRKLDYLSDASAVGWNPALLGMRSNFDLTLGSVLSATSLSLTSSFGFFAKFFGIGLGYTVNPAISGSSGELYAGYGRQILDDFLWGGISARWSLTRASFFDYNAYLLAKPLPGLLVSAGATTMTMNSFDTRERRFNRIAENLVQYSLSASYAFSESLTFLATARTHSLTDIQRPSLELGASMSFLNAALIVSGNVHILQPVVRLGVDINSDILDLGYAANIFAQAPTQHIIAARFSSDNLHSVRQIRDKRIDTELCTSVLFPDLHESASFVRSFSRLNPLLAESFDERGLTRDSSRFFANIRQQFYTNTIPKPNTTTASAKPDGNSLFAEFTTDSNYRFELRHLDYSRYPRISAIVRISDSLGRTVQNIRPEEIRLSTGTMRIAGTQQLDTSLSVPVDIVMLIDCSGSMSDKIAEVREKIDACLQKLRLSGADARIGGILYGTEILDVLQPTEQFGRFEELLARANATQPDEYTPAALDELVGMKFRPDAERVGIVVSDELTYPNRRPFVREAIMLKDLWRQRISISKLMKPCNSNGSATAYLTLGREYDISSPFTDVFAGIGKAATMLTAITLEPAPNQAYTCIAGDVQNQFGTPQQAQITLTDVENDRFTIGPFPTLADGTFRQAVPEGRKYRALIQPMQADTNGVLVKTLDATRLLAGDTLRQTFVVQPRTVVRGMVRDQFGTPVQADMLLRDNTDFAYPPSHTLKNEKGEQSGRYELPLMPGRKYTVIAVPSLSAMYQPLEYELDTRGFQAGTPFEQNFTVQRISRSIRIEGRIEQEKTSDNNAAIRPENGSVQGVQVVAVNQANQAVLTKATSDSAGAYVLFLPKGMSAELRVEAAGYPTARYRIFIRKTDTATVLSLKTVLQRQAADEEEMQAKRLMDTILSPTTSTASAKTQMASARAIENISPPTEIKPKKEARMPETRVVNLSFADARIILPTVIDVNGKEEKRTWQEELDSLAAGLKRELAELTKIVIVGHTDDRASLEANRAEGWQRANFVVEELVRRGIPQALLMATSQGNAELLPRNKKESDKTYRLRCRRVEVMKIWSVK